jgi:hypothetical protein
MAIQGYHRFPGRDLNENLHQIIPCNIAPDALLASGISTGQSAPSGLAETDLSGGFRSIGVNYNYRHYINANWQLFGEALYEHYSDDIADSPISRKNYEAEVGIGFIYVF